MELPAPMLGSALLVPGRALILGFDIGLRYWAPILGSDIGLRYWAPMFGRWSAPNVHDEVAVAVKVDDVVNCPGKSWHLLGLSRVRRCRTAGVRRLTDVGKTCHLSSGPTAHPREKMAFDGCGFLATILRKHPRPC